MKVLMFGWEFPPHISGGLGTACYGLTKAILKQNVEIIFVVPKMFGDEETDSIRLVSASEIPINLRDEFFSDLLTKVNYLEVDSMLIPYADDEEYFRLTEQIDKGLSSELLTTHNQKFSFSGGYGRNLLDEVRRYALVGAEIARSFDFDVIHAHDWLTYLAGIEAKKISRKPLVVHMHATEFDRSGENVNQQVYDIEKAGMEAADRVVSVSNLTRNRVITRYGINPDKVITVHNGVDAPYQNFTSQATKNVDEKIVTFLGRITFQKGPEYFIEAANKVLKRDPNVRFVMAGSGDMMHKMVRRVAALGISTRFHFTGFLRGEDVEKMYGMSDVYVMPSVSEPFGISPLEAMMSNVPVIISKQSGVAEVLNYAIKVDFWDIDAMADAIYGLLHFNALPEMFRKYGKAEVESIQWENAGKKVIEIYHSLLHSD